MSRTMQITASKDQIIAQINLAPEKNQKLSSPKKWNILNKAFSLGLIDLKGDINHLIGMAEDLPEFIFDELIVRIVNTERVNHAKHYI